MYFSIVQLVDYEEKVIRLIKHKLIVDYAFTQFHFSAKALLASTSFIFLKCLYLSPSTFE